MDIKNDVYALCAVYFVIEMYNPDYLIEKMKYGEPFETDVIKDENVKPYDESGNELGSSEL